MAVTKLVAFHDDGTETVVMEAGQALVAPGGEAQESTLDKVVEILQELPDIIERAKPLIELFIVWFKRS